MRKNTSQQSEVKKSEDKIFFNFGKIISIITDSNFITCCGCCHLKFSKLDKMANNKMKKLNIFAQRKRVSEQMSPTTPTTDTLHRIVNAKEEARRRWEEEQELFDRRKREHELKMVEIERAEVTRREEEIRRRNEELDERRRKNRLVQDTVAEQLRSLQMKLEEYKVKHKEDEELLEDDITTLEDKLLEVKSTLEERIRNLQLDDTSKFGSPPSAPHPDDYDGASGAYPTLPVPLARSMMSGLDASRYNRSSVGQIRPSSQGSSPNASSSSRSDTPKTDDQSDFDSSV